MINVHLGTADINVINISTLDFRTWQHFNSYWTPPNLQKLANVLEVLATQLYRGMTNTSVHTHLFTVKDDDKDMFIIWTVLKHPVTYIHNIGIIFVDI